MRSSPGRDETAPGTLAAATSSRSRKRQLMRPRNKASEQDSSVSGLVTGSKRNVEAAPHALLPHHCVAVVDSMAPLR
jgi:hypothetical protein